MFLHGNGPAYMCIRQFYSSSCTTLSRVLSQMFRPTDTNVNLQVIRLYEQFRLPDLIVTLAKTAISIAEDDDPNVVSRTPLFKRNWVYPNVLSVFNVISKTPLILSPSPHTRARMHARTHARTHTHNTHTRDEKMCIINTV